MTAEEEAKVQKTLVARNREREQNKLRMRRVREAQRAAREVEIVSSPAGWFDGGVVLYNKGTHISF